MERLITNNNFYFGSIVGIKSLDSPDLILGFCSSLAIELCNYHTYTSCNHKEANREEEPKEPLGIVTEIAAIIFLVSFTNFILFIDKHGINLTDMHLHLRDQVQDSNTDLDTQLRHSDTDLDTDHDTFVEDHDTIHSYHDTNHDTKRVPLTNKQKDIVNFCSVPRTSREILERAGVVYHTKNIAKYITSLVAAGYLQMTNPDNPTASNQKYKKVTTK